MCSSFGPLGKIDRTEKKGGMDLGDGVAEVDTLRRSAAHLLSLPRSLCSAGPVGLHAAGVVLAVADISLPYYSTPRAA
jgi:hypothetical protein